MSHGCTRTCLLTNPSGKSFAVLATWVANSASSNYVPVNVKDSLGNTLTTVYVDQKLNPGDYQDETGRWWEVIGTFMNFPASWTTISPQILSGDFGYG